MSGIVDERHSKKKRSVTIYSVSGNICIDTVPSSQSDSISGDNAAHNEISQVRHGFEAASTKYYKVASKEELVRLQIAYGQGSFVGVFHAVISCAENAVQLAAHHDKPKCADDAFKAVATRLPDVYHTVRSLERFDPEPESNGPSPTFAQARINLAKKTYRETLNRLRPALKKRKSDEIPGQALLPPPNKYFRNIQ